MKKLLLASVATLAVAAFAAGQAQAADAANNGLKLTVGGYLSVQGAYASQNDNVGQPGHNVEKMDLFQYGELHFTAEKTFDNGLTVGYEGVIDDEQAGLASTTTGGATTTTTSGTSVLASFRQNFGYFSGNWGRFEAGQNYSPLYYMSMGAPAVNDEFDSIDPDFSLVNITQSTAAGSTTAVSRVGAGNYASVGFTPFYKNGQDSLLADKVVYYTPRFNGFQLGADYTPSPNRTGDGVKSAIGGLLGDQTGNVQDERYDIAGGYDGSFSGVGVKVSGGYGHSTQENSVASYAGAKDQQGYIGGAQLSWQGWTVGGGYVWDNNGQKFTDAGLSANGDTQIWNAGLGYGIGPYHAGVTYQQSSTDVLRTITTPIKSDDQLKRWVVGGGYKVAPGVDLETTLQFDKYETAGSGLNANPTGNNNATVFTVGSTVNF